MSFMLFLQYQGPLRMNELLIVIHFGFKDHGHLLMSFFSRKKLLFVGGSLAAGSRQQAAGSRQQAAGSRQQAAGSRQQAAGSRQLRDFAPRDKLGTGGQLLQLGTRN
jgi:hypothetical protein